MTKDVSSDLVGHDFVGMIRVLLGPGGLHWTILIEEATLGRSAFPSLPNILGEGKGAVIWKVEGQTLAERLVREIAERNLLILSRIYLRTGFQTRRTRVQSSAIGTREVGVLRGGDVIVRLGRFGLAVSTSRTDG